MSNPDECVPGDDEPQRQPPWHPQVNSPASEPEPPTCVHCGGEAMPDYDLCHHCQFTVPLERYSNSVEIRKLQTEINELLYDLQRLEVEMSFKDELLPVHKFWADKLGRLIRKRRL